MGFRRGQATPCAFYHDDKQLRVVVRGGDFTVLGDQEALDWFRSMATEGYEATFRGSTGPDDKAGNT